MVRILAAALVALVCPACGSGVSSYEDGMEAQAEIMTEMVSVLEGVTDENSANAAATEIEALGDRLAEVSSQMREIPPPSMEEMQGIAQKFGKQTQDFQQKAATQMMKLAQYESLGEAWTRALSNMK